MSEILPRIWKEKNPFQISSSFQSTPESNNSGTTIIKLINNQDVSVRQFQISYILVEISNHTSIGTSFWFLMSILHNAPLGTTSSTQSQKLAKGSRRKLKS